MHAKLSFLGVLAVLALGVAIVGVSHAQYPPPGGAITVESEETTTNPGDSTEITCIVGVPNVACTMSIDAPDGSTAAIGSTSVTKITNAQGIATATLYVGTVPGVIVVTGESQGLISSVVVVVNGEASPPQSPVSNIQPPSTGSGGLAH